MTQQLVVHELQSEGRQESLAWKPLDPDHFLSQPHFHFRDLSILCSQVRHDTIVATVFSPAFFRTVKTPAPLSFDV